MFSRWMIPLTLLGLAALPAPARAADEKSAPPTVLVRLRSLDGVLEDFKYFLATAGQKPAVDQLDAVLKAVMTPNGFEGIDAKKPWAVYGVLDANLTGAYLNDTTLSTAVWNNTTCPGGTNSSSYTPQTCVGH